MRSVLGWVDVRNFFITFFVFLVIDMIWLAFIAKPFYAKHLGYLMAPKANLAAALIFYALFVLGILHFVLYPALAVENWTQALFSGLFFGLVTYATYDLTNLATIRDWPLLVTAVDLLWGSFVSGATATAGYFLIRLFKA